MRGVPYQNRDAAIHLGYVTCKELASGVSWQTLANMIVSDGVYTSGQAGVLIGAAVGGLCPYEASLVPTG